MAPHSSTLAWKIPWVDPELIINKKTIPNYYIRIYILTRSWTIYTHVKGFPGGSDGKESPCNAGYLGLIPGLGRSPGEEHGNPP